MFNLSVRYKSFTPKSSCTGESVCVWFSRGEEGWFSLKGCIWAGICGACKVNKRETLNLLPPASERSPQFTLWLLIYGFNS